MKISEFRRKILTKFELNCVLFRYHIFRNKPIQKIITDADFPTINLYDILTIVSHFRSIQSDNLSMGSYHAALGFLKDYVAEFFRCDFELAPLFGAEKYLAKFNLKLP